MAAAVGRTFGGAEWHLDAPAFPRPEKAASPAGSSHADDNDWSIAAGWGDDSWKNGQLGGLHNWPTFARGIVAKLLDKAGYRGCGQGGEVKHKSFWFSAEQFSCGGRSDSLHQKALTTSKALVAARLLKRFWRINDIASTNKKESWGGVVAAFKRFDFLFDRNMHDQLVPEALREPAQENSSRRDKIVRWSKTLVSAGCWAKRLLRLAHIFTGLCEMNSAPHGFYFRCILNTIRRNVPASSAEYKGWTFVITAGLGILVASLYAAYKSPLKAAVNVALLPAMVGFALLSAAFGGLALVTRVLAMPFILKANIDIEGNKELQKTLKREADVQLYQIDTLIKTVLYNLQDAGIDLSNVSFDKDCSGSLLDQHGHRQTNAYRVLCKAMQRKTDGFQISRLGRSTDVQQSGIAKALCEAYYQIPELALNKTNATERIAVLRNVLGKYLNTPVASKRASLALENEFVYLRELAAVENPHAAIDEWMDEDQKEYLTRVVEGKQEKKDLRIRIEEQCKTLNKKLSSGFAAFFGAAGLTLFAKYFRSEADDANYQRKLAEKRANLLAYAHDSSVMAENMHCYSETVQRWVKAAKVQQSFCFNWVLATNAQSSRGYAGGFRWGYKKATGRLPSIILCTNLGRFLGGIQVALFTLGLGALATAASATVEFALGGGRMVFSTIITGTLMAILGAGAMACMLVAKALVCYDRTHFKGAIHKQLPESRLKENDKGNNFTMKPLPPEYVAR